MANRILALRFGAIMRQMRAEAGLSQEEFAVRCQLHRTYIGSIERGEKNVTLETATKIANALGVTLSYLILRMEEASNDRRDDHGS
jgi:transcriptional regulator with XRE-family HTH domain